MTNFKKIELGKINEIKNKEQGKIFIHDELNLTSCEVSINCSKKGFKVPFLHKHKNNEEIYIFLKGKGIMEIDNEKIEVKEGSVVKIAPPAIRTMENTSDEDLEYIVIQAKENSLEGYTMTDAEIV